MLPPWPFTLKTSWRSPPGSRLLYPCSIPGDMAVEESDDEFWRFVDEVSGGVKNVTGGNVSSKIF